MRGNALSISMYIYFNTSFEKKKYFIWLVGGNKHVTAYLIISISACKPKSYLRNMFSTLWPHLSQSFISRIPQQTLEILEKGVSILLNKT